MSSEKYITVYMRDYMREYRASHPEYVIKENEKTNERLVNKYNSDSDYKERKKQQAFTPLESENLIKWQDLGELFPIEFSFIPGFKNGHSTFTTP